MLLHYNYVCIYCSNRIHYTVCIMLKIDVAEQQVLQLSDYIINNVKAGLFTQNISCSNRYSYSRVCLQLYCVTMLCVCCVCVSVVHCSNHLRQGRSSGTEWLAAVFSVGCGRRGRGALRPFGCRWRRWGGTQGCLQSHR